MSQLEPAAHEEILYFGNSWEMHRQPECLESSPSLAESAPRESLWPFDLLDQDAACPPTMPSPPLLGPPSAAVRQAVPARPTMVKANSFSEGVHDFDDMSHFLSFAFVPSHASFQHQYPHQHMHSYTHPHPQPHSQAVPQVIPQSHLHAHTHVYQDQDSGADSAPDYHFEPVVTRNGFAGLAARAGHTANAGHIASTGYTASAGHAASAGNIASAGRAATAESDYEGVPLAWQSAPSQTFFESFAPESLSPETRIRSAEPDSSPPALPSSAQSTYFSDAPADTASESSSDLHDRFYQAFNNPTQRPTSSKHESVYQQLIDDKPLMEALSKRVKRGYYRCAHCPKMFSNVLEYAKHIDEFEIQRDYKCPFVLCPWKILGLPRRPELRRHCAIQHKMEIPKELKSTLKLGETDFPIMECTSPYCDKKFYRRDSYARHVAMVHDKADSRFNKRLVKVLAECPYEQDAFQHRGYVMGEMMKTKKKTK